ncbi:MAG: DsbA family protein, partial [Byssovorax sp.]
MLKSLFRKASIAALLGVVACGAQPPSAPAAPESPPVAQGAEAKGAAEGEGAAPADAAGAPAWGDSGALGAPAARGGMVAGSADLGPVPVTAADPAWGNANAPVTIVEFSDFQCPFCDRLNSTLEQLRKMYGPTRLRIVWKNNPLPFHKHARDAAETAMALHEKGGSSWFWQFHDAVFRKRLTGLEVLAESYQFTGLDPQQVSALVARGTAARKVDDDMALAKQIGATGTPASFINGVFLSGAQPVDAFSKIIDEQLVAAGALAAQGIPANLVYARLTTENTKKAPPPPQRSASAPSDDDKTIWRIPVGTSAARANAAAPVTMIMFSD